VGQIDDEFWKEEPVNRVLALVAVIALFSALNSSAQSQTVPATQPFETPAEIDANYVRQLAELQRNFKVQTRVLRDQRVDQLRVLLDRAMEKKDAKQVVNLSNLIKVYEAAPDDPAVAPQPVRSEPRPTPDQRLGNVANAVQLQRFLIGTKWEWGADTLELTRDGTVREANWVSRGLVTRWEAIDRRTVLLTITSGRDDNRLALLRFDENLMHHDAISFEGGKVPNNRRVKN